MSDSMLNRHLDPFRPGQRVLVEAPSGRYVGHVAKVDPKNWPTPITVTSDLGWREHGPFRLTTLPADNTPSAIEEWLDA